jgi:hypothetical protein
MKICRYEKSASPSAITTMLAAAATRKVTEPCARRPCRKPKEGGSGSPATT